MKQIEKIPYSLASAKGLKDEDRDVVMSLYKLYQDKLPRNLLRDKYYEMKQLPEDLGLSVPPHLRNLEQVVGWCAKAVDSLANRSQFDGYIITDEDKLSQLQSICMQTNLKRVYSKAVRSELKHSCVFMTVTSGIYGEPCINAYPATASAGLWSDSLGRIVAGMVVVDRDNSKEGQRKPLWVRVFTETDVIEIKWDGQAWTAIYEENNMGRCLMEVLAYNATLERPFGTSRITRSVMNITDSAMRASVRSEISAEFFTSPQKYLLGGNQEELGSQSKWDAYIGNIFAVSSDGMGQTPQFGQLPQGTMQPHVDYMRSLAARFSGETNIPISELGIVSDNPSSAEAIYASKEPLVIDAQNLNEALTNIALMALAVKNGTDYKTELLNRGDLQVKFRNPALPSLVSQADAITKAISAIPWIGESSVALEELGFDDSQRQRMLGEKRQYEVRQRVNTMLETERIRSERANGQAGD